MDETSERLPTGDEVWPLDAGHAEAVVGRWARPAWATRTSVDDLRIDHEHRAEPVHLQDPDNMVTATLSLSDTVNTDGGEVAITRGQPIIDLSVDSEGTVIGFMGLDEAGRLAQRLLELVALGRSAA